MIRKLTFLAALALAVPLAACDPGSIGSAGSVPTPASVAQHTTADEQAMLRAEQAYKLARTLSGLAVDTGLAKGGNLVRLQTLDNRLYAALTTARAAYRAFNSDSLLAAANNVADLAEQVRALSGDSK